MSERASGGEVPVCVSVLPVRQRRRPHFAVAARSGLDRAL